MDEAAATLMAAQLHGDGANRSVAGARPHPSASILTVGSELTEGLRIDTNTREIAFALGSAGYRVCEAVSVGDDIDAVASTLERLCARDSLVVVTGGLGPTHDDITREGASRALGLGLAPDAELARWLESAARRHTDAHAAEQVYRQAEVLEGALVLAPVTGTAPGQVVSTPAGKLALLPGPPAEMRPMLTRLAEEIAPGPGRAGVRHIGCTGMTESDAQVLASRALRGRAGIALTVLARPGDVQVLLLDEGAGEDALACAASDVAASLGDRVYAVDGSTLAETVLTLARKRSVTLAVAESCTGGMIAAALTDVAGSSDVFAGGVVSYANSAKTALLGVSHDALAHHGAVSADVAVKMAAGVAAALGANAAIAVTGIAGPGGGTQDKPVGLVWFAVASGAGVHAESRRFPGDRTAIRLRATTHALDLLRRTILDL